MGLSRAFGMVSSHDPMSSRLSKERHAVACANELWKALQDVGQGNMASVDMESLEEVLDIVELLHAKLAAAVDPNQSPQNQERPIVPTNGGDQHQVGHLYLHVGKAAIGNGHKVQIDFGTLRTIEQTAWYRDARRFIETLDDQMRKSGSIVDERAHVHRLKDLTDEEALAIVRQIVEAGTAGHVRVFPAIEPNKRDTR
jgi:hypothetical protein